MEDARPSGWSLENDDDEEEASPLLKPAGGPSSLPTSLNSSTQSVSKQLNSIPASAPINAPAAPEPEIDPLDAFMMGIQSDVQAIEKKDAKGKLATSQSKTTGTPGSSSGAPLRERFYADDEIARQEEEPSDSDEDVRESVCLFFFFCIP